MATRAQRDRKIRSLAKKGLTYAEIGRLTGVTRQRAHQIVKDIHSNTFDSMSSKSYDGSRLIEQPEPNDENRKH